MPCTKVIYDQGGTIQRAGCLIDIHYTWLIGAKSLGHWPHHCEVIRGKVIMSIVFLGSAICLKYRMKCPNYS